jgi:hypothetical protein
MGANHGLEKHPKGFHLTPAKLEAEQPYFL